MLVCGLDHTCFDISGFHFLCYDFLQRGTPLGKAGPLVCAKLHILNMLLGIQPSLIGGDTEVK